MLFRSAGKPTSEYIRKVLNKITLMGALYLSVVAVVPIPLSYTHLVTAKPAETRMGSGKGSPEYWVAVVKPGRVMFEIAGVSEELSLIHIFAAACRQLAARHPEIKVLNCSVAMPYPGCLLYTSRCV